MISMTGQELITLSSDMSKKPSTLHVSVFVGAHLCQPQHRVLTAQTVIVRLFAAMLAILDAAHLTRSEFFETGRLDTVQFLVLATVRHHFIGVSANEFAFETVKVRGLVLGRSCKENNPKLGYVQVHMRSTMGQFVIGPEKHQQTESCFFRPITIHLCHCAVNVYRICINIL